MKNRAERDMGMRSMGMYICMRRLHYVDSHLITSHWSDSLAGSLTASHTNLKARENKLTTQL